MSKNQIRFLVFSLNTLLYLLIIISATRGDDIGAGMSGVLFFMVTVLNYRHGFYQAKLGGK